MGLLDYAYSIPVYLLLYVLYAFSLFYVFFVDVFFFVFSDVLFFFCVFCCDEVCFFEHTFCDNVSYKKLWLFYVFHLLFFFLHNVCCKQLFY